MSLCPLVVVFCDSLLMDLSYASGHLLTIDLELSLKLTSLRGAGMTFTVLLGGAALTSCGDVPTAEVGACINSADLPDGEVDEINTVSCEEPHDLEVFHAFDLPEGDYPGETAVEEKAGEECIAAFEEYVGIDYYDSELWITTIHPTEETWNAVDDRELLCLIDGDETTSSVKDAKT